ncbi:hypothetical protein LCGC14_1490100 [marine sediment metagenome]|uniref:Phage ABA sandwich domain-containing protein n=1 Tax=marine sediment metagenome TaxID=412755 RepID=A0A0F9M8R5_9ZZZZ
MGKAYLQPYEKGLIELFDSIRGEIPPHLNRVDKAREVYEKDEEMKNKEIDKATAEKIMRWYPDDEANYYSWGDDFDVRWMGEWKPSTNIANAIEALEKMGWRAEIKYNPYDPDGKKYWIKFPLNSSLDWVGAETLEMAISTALLATLEIIKDKE